MSPPPAAATLTTMAIPIGNVLLPRSRIRHLKSRSFFLLPADKASSQDFCTDASAPISIAASSSTSSSSSSSSSSRSKRNQSHGTELHQQPPDCTHSCRSAIDTSTITRRNAALQTAIAMAFTAVIASPSDPLLALASDDDLRVYSDDINKYRIAIPRDWQVGSGEGNGIKSVTAFYPEEAAAASNVSVVITGLGPDFTRLESFGKVDAFAENLVSGLDRSWQRPPGVAAKLIDCKAANGLYYIEYTLQNPGESQRHIYSALAVGNNGWYNRLYTITGQFLEEESGNYSTQIEKVVKSFRLS